METIKEPTLKELVIEEANKLRNTITERILLESNRSIYYSAGK